MLNCSKAAATHKQSQSITIGRVEKVPPQLQYHHTTLGVTKEVDFNIVPQKKKFLS